MRKVYIYALKSPIDGLVMYIGKTNDPELRHKQHVFEAWRYAPTSAKLKWISELLENDLEPGIEVIDTCDESNYRDIEARWIAHYAKENPLLTNRQKNPLADFGRESTVENDAQTTVRMPTDLMDWLKQAAERDHRSLNSQIVLYLEQARSAETTGHKT